MHASTSMPHCNTPPSARESIDVPSSVIIEVLHDVEIRKIKNVELTAQQRTAAKVIFMLGETGVGKTTMIDSMVNYLLGVAADDKVRYKIVAEQFGTSQTESQTRDVGEYRLASTILGCPMIIVDTPGFNDTRSHDQDDINKRKMRDYLLYTCPNLHAICFLVKSNANKLTGREKYVIGQVLQFFGADAGKNLYAMFTFADHKRPAAHQALIEAQVPCSDTFKFNNSIVFPDKNPEEEYDVVSPIGKMYWDIFEYGMKGFFSALMDTQQLQLSKTQTVIKLRMRLENAVMVLQSTIQSGIEHLKQIKDTIAIMERHASDIDNNKNFSYTVEESRLEHVYLPPGVHTTHCQTCNRTCHESCAYSNNDEKRSCIAINEQGYCTICPKKCWWQTHINVPYKVVQRTYTVKKEYAEMKAKFQKSRNEALSAVDVVKELQKKYKATQLKVYGQLKEMKTVQSILAGIALRPSVVCVVERLKLLEKNETNDMKHGWEQRIAQIRKLIEFHELMDHAQTNADEEAVVQKYLHTNDGTVVRGKLVMNKLSPAKDSEGNCNVM